MRTRKTKVDKKVAAKSLSAEVTPTYDALVSAIESLVRDARTGLKAALNTIMLQTYWRTGEYIVEYEQHGRDRAVYGDGLMRRLAHDLTLKLGRGFAHSNLNYMRKFYLVSQKIQTSGFFGKGQTSGFLTWSHYLEILRADDPLEIAFYAKECENSKWKPRMQSFSKPIIDEIDELLAKHYGFTVEELDFIINYDIKYRMGDKLNDAEYKEKTMSTLKISKHSDVPTALDLVKEEVDKESRRIFSAGGDAFCGCRDCRRLVREDAFRHCGQDQLHKANRQSPDDQACRGEGLMVWITAA